MIDAYFNATARGITLVNHGLIQATGFAEPSAILTISGGNFITNSGTISAVFDSAIELYDDTATGLGNRIYNSGRIESGGGNAIWATGTGLTELRNSGEVLGSILLNNGAITNSGLVAGEVRTDANMTLLNTGDILGNVTSYGTMGLRNSGTIEGNLTLYGTGTIVNTGLVTGSIAANGVSAEMDLRGGQVLGTVYGSAGNDIYRIDDPGVDIVESAGMDGLTAWCDIELAEGIEMLQLRGAAQLGQGNALDNGITGNGLANLIEAAEGNDTLAGYAGADSLWGEAGNDSLYGGRGADLLQGEAGRDVLNGDEGADQLMGGIGNDKLSGGDGDDLLSGGTGSDDLTGGAGRDVFLYAFVTDSGPTVAARDQILDFTSGQDVIDLSAIDAIASTARNDAFTLVAGLTGTAGQLTLRIAAGVGFLEGDVTGDGLADLSIRLGAVTSLAAADLLL